MRSLEILFWFCIVIIIYTYVGYGVIVWMLNKIKGLFVHKKANNTQTEFLPPVALIIAAYNEEDYVEEKIKNSLSLNYPAGKLKIYFVTDGSTDGTPIMVARYPGITLFHQPERKGKANAMNRAMTLVTEPYVVFCDANTLLNEDCIKEIVKHYADSRVGAVAGEKKIYQPTAGKAASAGEGFYWKYESFLKKQDSLLYSVVGAAGELFSVRKELYETLEPGLIIEDFVLSMRICMKGYVVRYAPEAYALETASASIPDERKRKIRICAGGFQSMYLLRPLFNIFRYKTLSFQYISHRVLRWSVTPVCLVSLVPLSFVLFFLQGGWWYSTVLIAQISFYTLSIIGWLFANKNIKIKALYIPYYFLFMNLSVFMGLKRYLKGQQTVLWEKAERQKIN
jgi:poly-beta-1,6-N-acetyl-D-glucosamine synthase